MTGGILTTSIKLLAYASPNIGPVREKTKRGYSQAVNSGYVWDKAQIVYAYANADVKKELEMDVKQAIDNWRRILPWMSFREDASQANAPGIATIVQGEGTCSSPVGYQGNAVMKMTLTPLSAVGQVDKNGKSIGGFCGVNEIVHEFGHLIGLKHEATRSDRQKFLTFKCQNLRDFADYNTKQCIGRCPDPLDCCAIGCGKSHNFIQSGTGYESTSYDIDSLMQYGKYDFSISPGTLAVLDGAPEDTKKPYPTPTDAKTVCEMYGEYCAASGKGYCGDKIVNGDEDCDDGNRIDGDGKIILKIFDIVYICLICSGAVQLTANQVATLSVRRRCAEMALSRKVSEKNVTTEGHLSAT